MRVDEERLFETWRELVEIESGSHDGDGILEMAEVMTSRLKDLGFEVRELGKAASGGPHLIAERTVSGSDPILMLGHLDTVWPPGTLQEVPFRREGDQLFGPGVADMKGGLAVMLEALQNADETPSVRVILTADEELGTPTGRSLVEENAVGCRASLVFEAGRPGGGMVDRRRGIAVFTLTTHGRTAHAGNDPQNGINAVDELAHQLLALAEMRDLDRGVYVMAGQIEGGTARQVVPDRASALIDVRGATREGLDEMISRIRALENSTHVPGARVTVEGGETRPPFEPVEGMDSIKAIITRIADEQGFAAEFVAGGGGSDGNFTAAVGVPTVDALGPVGHRLCSKEEWAEWHTALQRSTLVAGFLEAMADGQ